MCSRRFLHIDYSFHWLSVCFTFNNLVWMAFLLFLPFQSTNRFLSLGDIVTNMPCFKTVALPLEKHVKNCRNLSRLLGV